QVDPSTTNQTVTLRDSHYEFEDAPVVLDATDEDAPFTFPYTIEWDLDEATPGKCTEFTNTANIVNKGDVDLDSTATVEVCVEAALVVTKTAEASFDRLYEWDIAKSVDETTIVVADSEATFDYTVDAIPSGYTDSGWAVSGEIEVTNSNEFGEITFDLTDSTSLGGECVVAGGTEVTLAGGEFDTFEYTCSFPGGVEEADYEENTNTATATWTDPAGDE